MKNRNTLRRERRYVRWMWLLTLVYTLVTFLNLGTLRFPQTRVDLPSGRGTGDRLGGICLCAVSLV